MTVKAIDKDENENGRVTYHFKVDGENVQETAEFSIDENSGELRTRQNLDRETRPRYQVSSIATECNKTGKILCSHLGDVACCQFSFELYNFPRFDNAVIINTI